MKIKELTIGMNTVITLVVKSAVPRETRAKKPFLSLEFYDGADTISGNYWDWVSGNIPDKNAILDVTCQVTEYMGNRQLNIKKLTTNTTMHLSDFMSTSSDDLRSTYNEAYAIACDLKDDFLRSLTLAILEQCRDLWFTVPGAKGVHHAFVGGTLVHSVSVAKIAMNISRCIQASNTELCFVGGLLHDIGKLYTYSLNGIVIDMTDEGQLFGHLFIGAEFIGNFGMQFIKTEKDATKLSLLRHIILSHHGKPEYEAVSTPKCTEAYIVYHADAVDAEVQQIVEQSSKVPDQNVWTDKIYTLSNKPHLSLEYVKETFRDHSPSDM